MIQDHFPLFVRAKDSGEIRKFCSIRELQSQVEKIDIENEEYEAWDKDGRPVGLKLQETEIWIGLEALSDNPAPEQLRRALLEFAKSIEVQLPDHLPLETALDLVRAEQEKRMLAKSPIRRFFARLKQPQKS
jgi:hypothetical protein